MSGIVTFAARRISPPLVDHWLHAAPAVQYTISRVTQEDGAFLDVVQMYRRVEMASGRCHAKATQPHPTGPQPRKDSLLTGAAASIVAAQEKCWLPWMCYDSIGMTVRANMGPVGAWLE